MKPSQPRMAVISFFLALVLTTLACTTLLAPDNEVVIADATSVPVLVIPTTVPPTENIEPEIPEATNPPAETQPAVEGETEITPPSNFSGLFAPFWEVWEIVDAEFVDQPVDHVAMLQGALDAIATVSELSDVQPTTDSVRNFAIAAGTPDDLVEISLPFWQTWIRTTAPQDETLMRAAIHGMLGSLGDQHTSYMDPDQFIQANIPLAGEYEGIGAWVDPDGEFLTIISPMPDSPAEAAGLKPGDQVIKVDGEDMTGIDGNLVIRRVLGPSGSQVILTIRREGVEEFDVTITRAKIVIPSVTGEILEEHNLAYVQLFNFGKDTDAELREVLNDLLAQNPSGLILDLRNNGGGYLVTAIEIASEFIEEGVIMYEDYGDGERDTYDALGNGVATTIPMVVLINEGSASASEILAGAIQDYDRAPLVGMTSFGKGSVQSWIPLTSEDGAVRVTIARWYTPKERLIHEIGLTPDVVVEFTEADAEAEIDPQLDKAIEILLNP
jgi:carboxyl-terminal processing protease